MVTIKNILTKQNKGVESVVTIRDHFTDDDKEIMIEKQREFYMDKHGFDETFLGYLRNTFEAEIEKIWIAEIEEKFAGCIGLVKKDDKTAQLRWYIVDATASGKGVGTKLIQTLLNYCKKTQYEKISLETVCQLKTARRLYSKFGFELIKANEQFMWGLDLMEEHWELKLDNGSLN